MHVSQQLIIIEGKQVASAKYMGKVLRQAEHKGQATKSSYFFFQGTVV